jgi:adenylate cyclase
MTTDTFQRKLTAILSADVVGYSRLMGDDEEATVRTLNKYKKIISDLIERHNGRVIDSPGDNVLAEFVSVVDAVRCGVQIQEDLKENNEALPANRRMDFRIGINVGDVIQDGDRIYGDGVNVAARIESLADPRGICLSRTTYDQVKKKLKYEYEYLGEYEVKNIDEPVRVYRVQMEPKVKTAIVKEKKASALSEEPSIAVLPFVNISGDKEQEYFSDGLAEEIINALTKIQGLKVIARTSAFAFKGKDQDITKIAEALRVNTILEGSVRKSGKRIRVTAQLITASDGSHLWSERYDQELTDVFAIQDEISQAIAEKLRVRLSVHQPLVKRYTENMEAYNLYLKGRYHLEKFTPEALDKSKNYFEQAIAIDPKYALAWSELADYYAVVGAVYGYIQPRTAYAKCSHAIEKVLELDDTLPEPYAIRGALRAFDYDWEEAERDFHHALELKSR